MVVIKTYRFNEHNRLSLRFNVSLQTENVKKGKELAHIVGAAKWLELLRRSFPQTAVEVIKYVQKHFCPCKVLNCSQFEKHIINAFSAPVVTQETKIEFDVFSNRKPYKENVL